MPNFKVTFMFAEGNNGWTETYWREAANPPAASALTALFWTKFFTPRSPRVAVVAVRTSDADNPRVGSITRLVKTRRNSVGAELVDRSNEPPSAAALIEVTDAAGRRTTRLVRGLVDVTYDFTDAGTFDPARYQAAFVLPFQAAMIEAEFSVQHRAAWTGAPVKHLVSLAPGPNGEHSTTMQLLEENAFNAGDKIVFRRLPNKWFPGLRGIVEIAAQIDATHYLLPVRWTGPVSLVNATRAQARLWAPTYSRIQSVAITDLRAHRTGRPPGGHRGRSSAVRYR